MSVTMLAEYRAGGSDARKELSRGAFLATEKVRAPGIFRVLTDSFRQSHLLVPSCREGDGW